MSATNSNSPKPKTQSMSYSKSEVLSNSNDVVYRGPKSEIIQSNKILDEDHFDSQQSKSKSGNYFNIIIIGLVILGLTAGLVIGYKIMKSGNVQDEEQMNVFVNIVSQSLLSNLEQQKFLIIDDQLKSLKKFYEKQLTNTIWSKIVTHIQQQPNVLLSQDKKRWILKV
ncbi:unnamed protein product (macronuclear) [Paramecium tetraurelia]|uniref:Transmembrane protein n=1 Tax=Paramecium tetraurelia TaxID=5888 RepID=A0BTB2_PARTE|nr:uncharacterized protein GSPATT00032011001 [Paramecium tetraurelia]CAK61779.1 unnamed protein product [Paramecium tetraurelia]|eukprot:XP_001429177.1 hypothetical protein (macronuclear) [Paramecium tetraurelia strain d4-2]